jgi:Domain of unknown function (DUF4145)
MGFDAKIWDEIVHPAFIPAYPCPGLNGCVGRLHVLDASIRFTDHPSFCSIKHFQMFLQCGSPDCGAIVSVSGRTDIEVMGSDYEENLRPLSMFPAPPIIEIPRQTPRSVRTEIEKSFELFWLDLGACANRLRISLERIMDQAHIARSGSLAKRISAYKANGLIHGQTMLALKIVGNIGSHEGRVDRDVLLDAYRIYEDALAEIFGRRTVQMDAIRARIIETEGRSSRLRERDAPPPEKVSRLDKDDEVPL